jgi:hypothetical protein
MLSKKKPQQDKSLIDSRGKGEKSTWRVKRGREGRGGGAADG